MKISKHPGNKPHLFHGSRLFYTILVTFFGALFFTVPYLLYLAKLPRGVELFGYIFLWNILAGILAGIVARLLTAYKGNLFKTSQTLTKNILYAIIYSVLVYFGMIQYIFAKYNVSYDSVWVFLQYLGTSNFWELVGFLMVLKLIVYLGSDFISDKITFGPS
jgi:fructose-specific phosphotransferase system IIC component